MGSKRGWQVCAFESSEINGAPDTVVVADTMMEAIKEAIEHFFNIQYPNLQPKEFWVAVRGEEWTTSKSIHPTDYVKWLNSLPAAPSPYLTKEALNKLVNTSIHTPLEALDLAPIVLGSIYNNAFEDPPK